MAVATRGERVAAGVRSTPWISLFSVALYVIVLDQLTKGLVRSSLSPGESVHVVAGLWILPVPNHGIAGGALTGSAVPAALFATAAVLALLLFLAWRGAAVRSVLVGFGLLIGGGIGNLLDRVRDGYVTDFILHGNQVFNLADVAIVLGSAVIVVGVCETYVRTRLRPSMR